MSILQNTHFPPYGSEHTQSLFLRNTRLSKFKEKYLKFILTGIHYLSLIYFLEVLVMKLSKMKSIGRVSTHNHSGRLLAVGSFTLSLCIFLRSSRINLYHIMHIVKSSKSHMLSKMYEDFHNAHYCIIHIYSYTFKRLNVAAYLSQIYLEKGQYFFYSISCRSIL